MPMMYTVKRVEPKRSRNLPYSLILVGICVLVFLIQMIPGVTTTFWLKSETAFVAPWTFVTSMFLHGSFSHLFFNMFVLAIFGMVLEGIIGSRRFLILYFSAGIIAGFAYLATLSPIPVVGASGAIMGIVGCLAVLRPKMLVWVFGFAPMPLIAVAVLYILMDLAGTFSGIENGIANAAHLGGMFLGLAYGFWIRKQHSEPKKRILKSVSDKELDDWEVRYM